MCTGTPVHHEQTAQVELKMGGGVRPRPLSGFTRMNGIPAATENFSLSRAST